MGDWRSFRPVRRRRARYCGTSRSCSERDGQANAEHPSPVRKSRQSDRGMGLMLDRKSRFQQHDQLDRSDTRSPGVAGCGEPSFSPLRQIAQGESKARPHYDLCGKALGSNRSIDESQGSSEKVWDIDGLTIGSPAIFLVVSFAETSQRATTSPKNRADSIAVGPSSLWRNRRTL